mgnify:CR=1 FL=1
MCPAVLRRSGTLASRPVLDGVTSRGRSEGTGKEDGSPLPVSSGTPVPCEGALARGRVNLGEGSAPLSSGQISRGSDPAKRPEPDRATVPAACPKPPGKPFDLVQHVGCSSQPQGGGDKVGMGQAASRAATPARTEKPRPVRDEKPIASRAGGKKTTPADEQRSTCRLERETSQVVGLGSPDDQQPSSGTKPSRGGVATSQPGGERAGVLPPTGESPVSRDGCATPTYNREPVEEKCGLGPTGLRISRSSLSNEVIVTGERAYRCREAAQEYKTTQSAGIVRVSAGVSRARGAHCMHQHGHDLHLASGTDYTSCEHKLSPLHPAQTSMSGAGR